MEQKHIQSELPREASITLLESNISMSTLSICPIGNMSSRKKKQLPLLDTLMLHLFLDIVHMR